MEGKKGKQVHLNIPSRVRVAVRWPLMPPAPVQLRKQDYCSDRRRRMRKEIRRGPGADSCSTWTQQATKDADTWGSGHRSTLHGRGGVKYTPLHRAQRESPPDMSRWSEGSRAAHRSRASASQCNAGPELKSPRTPGRV